MSSVAARNAVTIFLVTLVVNASAQGAEDGNSDQEEPADSDTGPIRLQSIFVGDKEQPAVSYFVPWEGIGAPDGLFWNVEEKHDKALEPVDRQIMLRSMELYDEMQLESPLP